MTDAGKKNREMVLATSPPMHVSPVVGTEADPIALDNKSKMHVACVKTKDHICCAETMNHFCCFETMNHDVR